jgi:hypothetical protein
MFYSKGNRMKKVVILFSLLLLLVNCPPEDPCENPSLVDSSKDVKKEKKCRERSIIFAALLLNISKNTYTEPEPNNTFEEARCNDFSRKSTLGQISNSDTNKDKDYYFTNLKKSKFKLMRTKEEETGFSLKIYLNKTNRILLTPSTTTTIELTSSRNGKKYLVQLEEYDAGAENFVYFLFEAPTINRTIPYDLIKSSSTLDFKINADFFYNSDGSPTASYPYEGDFICSP